MGEDVLAGAPSRGSQPMVTGGGDVAGGSDAEGGGLGRVGRLAARGRGRWRLATAHTETFEGCDDDDDGEDEEGEAEEGVDDALEGEVEPAASVGTD